MDLRSLCWNHCRTQVPLTCVLCLSQTVAIKLEWLPRGLISYASCNEHWSADFAKVHSDLPAHFTTDTCSCVWLQLPPLNNYIFFSSISQSSHGWLSVVDSNSTGNRSGKRILGNDTSLFCNEEKTLKGGDSDIALTAVNPAWSNHILSQHPITFFYPHLKFWLPPPATNHGVNMTQTHISLIWWKLWSPSLYKIVGVGETQSPTCHHIYI